MKKFAGRADIENALIRLDRLTQEEVRMAAAQGLKATHDVNDKVQDVGDHVQRVDEKVQGVDNKVQQVADHMDDQKRKSFNSLVPLVIKYKLLS
jgi:methyl-accepting chemotaxis protein